MNNLSEEEKQALESLRKNRGVSFAQADIISNLIEKQQKEIEYEKELRVRYERRYDMCKESKDKLKKEIDILKELLTQAQEDVKIWKNMYETKE